MPTIRTWNFLLPETGEHQLKVEDLGEETQNVFIDGACLHAPPGTTQFTGPAASLLELTHEKKAGWFLMVNGMRVEEFNSTASKKGDDSIRSVRDRPDGSYTIATKFEAVGLNLHIVRRFQFTAAGILHTVEIGHQNWVWQVVHNGSIITKLSHNARGNMYNCPFQVMLGEGQKLDAEARMEWFPRRALWMYSLTVNHIMVISCWSEAGGSVDVNIPEVVGEARGAPVAVSEPSGHVESEEDVPALPVGMVSLPQGVSYDSASGSYQANIRVGSKFMFLGEFRTVDEAVERYAEAVTKYKGDGAPSA